MLFKWGGIMKEVVADQNLVGYCGLYCGACRKYLKEKCPGCHGNEKATWCEVRKCCMANNITSCADCKTVANANDCKKFNNFMSKLFGFIFRSDRQKCINAIKEKGIDAYSKEMAANKKQHLGR